MDAPTDGADVDVSKYGLNESQNTALRASMVGSLTLLWGPPGTGKSHTIVAILLELLSSEPSRRILVAAPTYNAVNNVMRKYISKANDRISSVQPIRVSTDVSPCHESRPELHALTTRDQIRKVAEDMRPYTCDAMMGQKFAEDFKALKVARKRIHDALLVFTLHRSRPGSPPQRTLQHRHHRRGVPANGTNVPRPPRQMLHQSSPSRRPRAIPRDGAAAGPTPDLGRLPLRTIISRTRAEFAQGDANLAVPHASRHQQL